jgi:anti-sigma factor RsiW
MPERELRPIIERVYWSAVSSLANQQDELVDEAVHVLTAATSACPEMLARLAEDDLLDAEARQGTRAVGGEGVEASGPTASCS